MRILSAVLLGFCQVLFSLLVSPRYVGPFPVTRLINLSAMRLGLPRSMHVHRTVNVSKLKPPYCTPSACPLYWWGPSLHRQGPSPGRTQGEGLSITSRLGDLWSWGAVMDALQVHSGSWSHFTVPPQSPKWLSGHWQCPPLRGALSLTFTSTH